MDEHLAAWQISEFILGGLDDDELGAVYRHVDACVGLRGLVGGRYSGRGLRVKAERQGQGYSPRSGSTLFLSTTLIYQVDCRAPEKSPFMPRRASPNTRLMKRSFLGPSKQRQTKNIVETASGAKGNSKE